MSESTPSLTHIQQNAEPYAPPESLWQLIKSVANERELDTIKSIIGESLIENNIDLHNEIDSLLEIWRDYRYETNVTLNQTLDQKNGKCLPEPPNMRETLKKEINFFVKQMRAQYKEDKHFQLRIATNNHNLSVINYVLNSEVVRLGSGRADSLLYSSELTSPNTITNNSTRSRSMASERPPTAYNRQTGTETPVVFNTDGHQSRQRIRYRPVSRSSSLQSPRNDQVKSVNSLRHDEINVPATLSENLENYVDEDKINCMQIDEIADHLRELLQQECDTLLKDIEFLYECIDQEREYRVSSRLSLREPSLNELKGERNLLESDLMSSAGKNQARISKLPSTVTTQNNNRTIKSPLVRPSPTGSASSIKSRISVVSTNDINLLDSNNLVKKPVVKRSSSLVPKQLETAPITNAATKTVTNSPHVKPSLSKPTSKPLPARTNSLSNKEKHDKPTLSRTNSVSSIASSVASSASSSTSSKLSAVQKFRNMVLESRD